MALKISKSELRLLRELCRSERQPSGLSKALNMKKSFVSRVLGSLRKKGFISEEERGGKTTVSLSPASHAQVFKKLSDSRGNSRIEKWLAGAAIDILIGVLAYESKADSGLLARESGCSKPTLYKIIGKLLGAGVVIRNNGKIEITDKLVRAFAAVYAGNLQFQIQEKANGRNISVKIGKEVVLRTDAEAVPDFFIQTGISALAKEGLEANIASWRDFYFNLEEKKRELTVEEKFAHAILLTSLPQHGADLELLALFYAKKRKGMNLYAIKKFAARYMVEGAFENIRGKVEFHEKAEELI